MFYNGTMATQLLATKLYIPQPRPQIILRLHLLEQLNNRSLGWYPSGVWLASHLIFNQIGALTQVQSGGIAYMAHVGGFIFGAITLRFFESRKYGCQQGLDQI
jgi:membrane associated rhomboid family serine protease